MERRSFQFKKEYFDAALKLSPSKRLALYEAIATYSLYGEKSILKGSVAAAFELILPALDKEIRETQEGRRSAEYKAWRTAVFARDNFTCQACREHGGRLNAHHIKRYSAFPDLRYSIDNGVTLCESCHKLAHRRRAGDA